MRHARLPIAAPLLPVLLLVAGCATRKPVAIVAPAPAPAVALAATLPPGASPGMLVPEPLADGSFPTPNQRLSAAGAVWHLRAGLNVAALSCGGEEGAAIRAGYNGWLTRQAVALRRVAATYAAEYGGSSFDDAMTRLYNFWSQTPVRPAFCAAAARVVADVAASDPATVPTVAAADLDTLDRPFTDFYRAYDAWRRGAPGGTVIAAAAVTPPGPAPHRPLTLDLSSLPVDAEVAGGR